MHNLKFEVIVSKANGAVSIFNAETREDAEDLTLCMRREPAVEVTINEDFWTVGE